MKMFKHSYNSSSGQDKIDQKTASKSKRVMRTERGSQPQHIKARRFDRALQKVKNR